MVSRLSTIVATAVAVCGFSASAQVAGAQVTYHLHREISETNPTPSPAGGSALISPRPPDLAAAIVQSGDLKGMGNGDHRAIAHFFSAQFARSASVPAGSPVTFRLWMRKTVNTGRLHASALLATTVDFNGLLELCQADSPSELTTTLALYVFSCTTPVERSVDTTRELSLIVRVLADSNITKTVRAEMGVEGTLNGDYDSRVEAPVPPPPPAITSLNPASGPLGAALTINGFSFGATQGASTATMNGAPVAVTTWSDTSIAGTVPATATTGPVVVTVDGLASNAITFTIPPPAIAAIDPGTGTPGTAVTVTGSGFGPPQPGSRVTFNGVAAVPAAWTPASIATSVPSGARTGPVVVTVNGVSSNATPFTVITRGTLVGTITRASDGSAVTGAAIQVFGGGAVAGSATSGAGGAYTIPDVEMGSNDVWVTAAGFASELRTGVTIAPAATTTLDVSLVAPGSLSGRVTESDGTTPVGGASVGVYEGTVLRRGVTTNASGDYAIADLHPGTFLIRASAVGYQTAQQSGVVVAEGGSTTANVTLTSAQAGPVTYVYDEVGRLVSVTDPAGNSATYAYDAVGNVLSISRTAAAEVSIAEFTPNGGPVGAEVTILGSGFSPIAEQNAVTFNGVAATVLSATATGLGVTVPAGATTGPIGVVTPLGSATSAAPFVVTAGSDAPSITGFTPTIGLAGTAVTIDGAGFDPVAMRNRTTVNETLATITAATTTGLSTTVPAGATSGRITVATVNGTAASAADFFVPPPPYTPADVSVTDRMAIGDTRTIGITAANGIGLVLFDAAAGQRVSIQIAGVTIPSTTTLKLYSPRGGSLLSANFGTSGTFVDPLLLPLNGTYTLLVDPSSTNTGSVTLTLNGVVDVSGTMTTDGSPVTVPIVTPGQTGRLTFNGTAGQGIFLTLTNSTSLSCNWTLALLRPDGTTLGSVRDCGGATTEVLDTRTLPSTGVYTVLVDPVGAVTGTVDIRAWSVTDFAGTITTDGTPVTVPITTPGQNGRLTFNGTAGQGIFLTLTNSTSLSCNWTLALLRPDGSTLASIRSCSSGTVELIDTRTLPDTGVYTVLVDPVSTITGSATVRAWSVTDVVGTITTDGTPVTVPITTPGQNGRLTFTGTAGQGISLTLTAGTSLSCNWTLALLRPDGSLLGSIRDCTSGTLEFLDTRALPDTGIYTVLVDPAGEVTGTVDIRAWSVTDVAGTITADGTPVTVPITTPGQNGRLTFTGTAGQGISLTLTGSTSLSCNWTMALLQPDGTTLGSIRDCTSGTVEFLDTRTLPENGVYTVLVDPAGTTTGTVDIRAYAVTDVTGPITTDGTPVTVPITTPGQNGRLTFDGTAGQATSLTLTGSTSLSCNWIMTLLRPDGSTLASVRDCTSGTVEMIDTRTLPDTGVYTVLVNPVSTITGTVDIRVYAVTDVTGPITADGTPVTVPIATPGQNALLTLSGAAGQTLALTLTSSGPLSCNWEMLLVRPDGTTQASVRSCTSGTTESITGQTLAVGGSYTVKVNPIAATTGTVTVTATSP